MTLTAYRNFDLLITRAGARYRAFVVEALAVAAISFRQALRFVRLQIRFGGRTAHGRRAARSDQS